MQPDLSIVVVSHEMARELPRTLASLTPPYQGGIDSESYELIVVDNGSSVAPDGSLLEHFAGQSRLERMTSPSRSPARAANRGLELARGRLVGLLIDGARIATPGLLRTALLASRLAERAVIATLGWHLGPGTHMEAERTGYDRTAEDRLLEESGWERDGYRLFAVSALSGSSRRGWFGPLGESNALFMPPASWCELGGLDERFELPGGGLVNHDLFARACGLDESELIVLLGEGTFHQIHGGASTSRSVTREEAFTDYERLRGHPFTPPSNQALYLGGVPTQSLEHVRYSAAWALRAESDGS